MTVNNLHLRIEEPEHNISLGFTIKQFSLYTTSDNGQRGFIDRTQEANKSKDLHRKAVVKGLNFYFRAQELQKYMISSSECTDEYRKQLMQYYIQEIYGIIDDKEKVRIIDTVMRAGIEVKITLRGSSRARDDVPQVSVQAVLKPDEATLEYQQMKQLLRFVDRIAKAKTKNNYKPMSVADPSIATQNVKEFRRLVHGIVSAKQGQEIVWVEALNSNDTSYENKQLRSLLLWISKDEIIKTLHLTIFNNERSKIIDHLISTKKKPDSFGKIGGALMSFFGGPKKEVAEAPEISPQEVHDFIMGVISKSEDEFKRGSEGFLTRIEILVEQGSLDLVNLLPRDASNVISVSVQGFRLCFEQKNSADKESTHLTMTLFDSQVLLKINQPAQHISREFTILRKVRMATSTSNMLNAVVTNEVRKGKTFTSVYASVADIELYYMTALVSSILNLAGSRQLKCSSEGSASIEELKAQTKKSIEEDVKQHPEVSLELIFNSLRLLVPLKQNGNPDSGCWVTELGTFKISSLPKEQDTWSYKTIQADLNAFQVMYFETIRGYWNWTSTDQKIPRQADAPTPSYIVYDTSLSVKAMMLEEKLRYDTGLESLKVSCDLEQVNMAIDPIILEKLVLLPECADYTKHSEFHEPLEFDPRCLVSSTTIFNVALGKDAEESYIALFYHEYLYLYKHLSDLIPTIAIKLNHNAVRVDMKKECLTVWVRTLILVLVD